MEFLNADNRTVESLVQAGSWRETTKRRFCLRNCYNSVESEANFVLSQNEGVVLLSLNSVRKDKTEVEPVILLDTGQKGVLDCVEEYGLKMDPSVLDNCIGKEAMFCAATKLKRRDVQSDGKRDKNPRKMVP